jgi:hypothetical protein
MGRRMAPQRAAGITGQVGVGEAAAQVAGKGEAVVCSTAVEYSLHLSGMTSATVPSWECSSDVGSFGPQDRITSFGTMGATRVVYISGRSLSVVKARRRL